MVRSEHIMPTRPWDIGKKHRFKDWCQRAQQLADRHKISLRQLVGLLNEIQFVTALFWPSGEHEDFISEIFYDLHNHDE